MTPIDPTEEIRAIKRKLAAEFDFDVHRIAEDLRRRQAVSGRTYVTRPPKRVEPSAQCEPAEDR